MVLLAAIMVVCMASGTFISRALPWSPAAHRARMPLTTGLALGPFLFGMAGILVLGFLPAASHMIHLLGSLAVIAAVLGGAWLLARRQDRKAIAADRLMIGEWFLAVALLLVVAGLIFITVFVPLTQNDSLEYATVGRILFETRTLTSYPVLDPETNSAGFFGPWTHPPLYVAAIYLVEVIQDHASAPGALRLIAPWFAITGAGVVYSIGALISRPTGLASALIFLSTPLLFLGASSALLDALYVSAFALLVAFISSIEARPAARGAIIGVVIGIGLWTHSVAILFIPLGVAGIALQRGLRHPRELAQEAASALLVAILVGGWHYWRNIELFGTPISDNPAVFALPQLHWDDYFLINRGLDTPIAMIQYGILKGWFAIEAFGATYWGMAVGFVLLMVRGWTPIWQAVSYGTATKLSEGILYYVFGLLIVYFLGVSLSILLGLDLMVKNERYILSIHALVAVGAAYGFVALANSVAQKLSTKHSMDILQTALVCLALVLVLQTAVYLRYTLRKNALALTDLGMPFARTLSLLPEYQLTDYLRTQTPKDSLILSLKPADMYYAERRMISYLDSRLLKFYQIDDESVARVALIELGVTHIYVPNYGIPPLYNSAVWKILRDPTLSRLEFSSAGGQIYSINPDNGAETAVLDVTPGLWPWTRQELFILGGRKKLGRMLIAKEKMSGQLETAMVLPFGLFQRNVATYLQTGAPSENKPSHLIPAEPGSQVAVDVSVEGRGHIGLRVLEYDSATADRVLREVLLGEFELSDTQPTRMYGRRIRVSRETKYIGIIIEYQGQFGLRTTNVSVTQVDSGVDQ
jgi:hypothetical protein